MKKIKAALSAIWEVIAPFFAIIGLSFFVGFGLFQGVASSNDWTRALTGKAIVITVIDYGKD